MHLLQPQQTGPVPRGPGHGCGPRRVRRRPPVLARRRSPPRDVRAAATGGTRRRAGRASRAGTIPIPAPLAGARGSRPAGGAGRRPSRRRREVSRSPSRAQRTSPRSAGPRLRSPLRAGWCASSPAGRGGWRRAGSTRPGGGAPPRSFSRRRGWASTRTRGTGDRGPFRPRVSALPRVDAGSSGRPRTREIVLARLPVPRRVQGLSDDGPAPWPVNRAGEKEGRSG